MTLTPPQKIGRQKAAQRSFLAIDLGAESGRCTVGTFGSNGRLVLEEVHRFPNRPLQLQSALHWNVYALYSEIVTGIGLAANAHSISTLGIDSWGVDFGLLGPNDSLLGLPYHYRDSLTAGVMDEVLSSHGNAAIFAETGIQFLPFNTLYQLIALRHKHPALLDTARNFLMIGELFTFWLTGQKNSEFTNATTTQLYNPKEKSWSKKLFAQFDLPAAIMPAIASPGTVVGELLPSIAAEVNAASTRVILPAVHDTGSAIAAVPGKGDNWCFLSSGTWSLLGIETKNPIMTARARQYNFTNEGGINNTFRVLKNVMGLWLLQQCRQEWGKRGQVFSYEKLMQEAEAAPPFRTLIDPDNPAFLTPGNMPEKIVAAAVVSGQQPPETVGQFVRCILESLALKYRAVLEQLIELRKAPIEVTHIVGGGAQSQLLNQFTANATGRLVIAGPTEATTIGNLLVQAITAGTLSDIKEARETVRASFDLQQFTPADSAQWNEAYSRFNSSSRFTSSL